MRDAYITDVGPRSGRATPREVARVCALLVSAVSAYPQPLDAVKQALGVLLGDPEAMVYFSRYEESKLLETLIDWRCPCRPQPELAQLYHMWSAGHVYVDRHGAYRYKNGSAQGRVVPWSALVRKAHGHVDQFSEAARVWRHQEPGARADDLGGTLEIQP